MGRIGHTILKPAVLLVLPGFFVLPSAGAPMERIAVVTKTRGTVEVRTSHGEEFSPVLPGTVLFETDSIRTAPDGFLVMVFLNDKSMLRVRQNVVMQVSQARTLSRYPIPGVLGGDLIDAAGFREPLGGFLMSKATSVASVKG